MLPNDTVSISDVLRHLSYDPYTGIFIRKIGTGKGAAVGDIAGTLTVKGYISISICRRRTFAHRLAFVFMTGFYPVNIVDHENNNRSDNRWTNLRLATKVSNAGNAKGHLDAKIPLKGVSLTSNGKFRASIGIDGKQIHLGTFPDAILAHTAYVKAASSHFKEFARS